MIDLHIHTIYSDGNLSEIDILKEAENKNLQLISITDHNTCDFYEVIKNIDYKKYYKGKFIVGCEFTTSFEGKIIEILGYGFDFEKMNAILKKVYSDEYWKVRNVTLGNKLLNILKGKEAILNLENCVIQKEDYFYYGISKLFYEVKRNKKNKFIISSTSMKDFSRNELYNPNSEFYLEYDSFFLPFPLVISLIHELGGLAFLAHPYEYGIDIDYLLNKIGDIIDGLECFYPTFTNQMIKYLIDFAKKKQLYISGGSDYHESLNELGIHSFDVSMFDWTSSFKDMI